MPMTRGILSTVYATLRDPGLVREDLITIYNAFYRSSSFDYRIAQWRLSSN